MVRKSPLLNGKTRVTFSLPADEPSGVVSVVGDFNHWHPGRHVLTRRRGKTRTVTVELTPGTHHFRYLATGGVWFDDPTVEHVRDGGSLIEI